MHDDLLASAIRVQQMADELNLAVHVQVMPASTRTAEDAATACKCGVGQIVKSLVFKGESSQRPYLLLVSGDNRVDERAVATRIGEKLVRANADFVRKATGFAIGGIPPFGHQQALETYVDADLLSHPVVWAAAGTPSAVFRAEPNALARAVGGRIISMGVSPSQADRRL